MMLGVMGLASLLLSENKILTPRDLPGLRAERGREMSTLHSASVQVYPGLQLKGQPRLNAYKLAN